MLLRRMAPVAQRLRDWAQLLPRAAARQRVPVPARWRRSLRHRASHRESVRDARARSRRQPRARWQRPRSRASGRGCRRRRTAGATRARRSRCWRRMLASIQVRQRGCAPFSESHRACADAALHRGRARCRARGAAPGRADRRRRCLDDRCRCSLVHPWRCAPSRQAGASLLGAARRGTHARCSSTDR